jgi:hypothetical protein
MTDFAKHLREMMNVWAAIEDAARSRFTDATEEEIYQIASSAMSHSLGIKVGQDDDDE